MAAARQTAAAKAHGRTTVAGISDTAVAAKTGQTWSEWLAVLDRAGAKKLQHPAIAKLLHEKHGLSGWWSQMVTVGYEQARGLREKHQRPDGYQVGGSRTIAVPLERLYRAWSDARQRRRWLADPGFTLRKATPNTSMRITWTDGQTRVDANFYARGAAKSRIAVQHGRLKTAAQAARMKQYWAEQLSALKAMLEA